MNKNTLIVLVIILVLVIGAVAFLVYKNSINSKDKILEQETIVLKVYFGNTKLNPNAEDCNKVFAVERRIPKTLAVARASLTQLFSGPTVDEKSQGYYSWFSNNTKDILKNIKIENSTAYVNLNDIRQIIPNASSSCGSAELLAEINNTLKQFSTINKVIIAIDQNPSDFYEWIQVGCSSENNFCDKNPFIEFGLKYSESQAKSIIENIAKDVILAIKNKDEKKLAGFVSVEKGVRFSPYGYIDAKNNLVFTNSQMYNFFNDPKIYNWGSYDGSGLPINFIPKDYYKKFIYDVDFVNAPQISYNKVLGMGNTLINQFEFYPNSIIVEYYFPGFEEKYQGMDWRSLRLIFEQIKDKWYLVGVAHDQWTI